MRMIVATSIGWLLCAGPAYAQGTAKNCGIHIEIDGRVITAATQSYTKCNHEGKVRLTVTNLDDAEYRVQLQNFKFKPAVMGGSCYPVKNDATSTATTAPFKKISTTNFTIGTDDIKIIRDAIPKKGDVGTGCYAFDVVLLNIGGTTEHHRLDPDLEVTEPGNPPPPPPPGGGTRKPPF